MKLVDSVVLDKFIQSLERDKTKWCKETGGAAGHTFTSYHSPPYKSHGLRTVSFVVENRNCKVYINGIFKYKIPTMIRINIFNEQSRRLNKGISEMKSYVNKLIKSTYEAQLLEQMRETVINNE